MYPDKEDMEQQFPRQIAALGDVFAFLDGCMAALQVGEADAFALRLVVEEFFTNVVKYSRNGSESIILRVSRRDKQLVVEIVAGSGEPFDVTQAPQVDTMLPLEQRKVGGLGIHLARNLCDSLEYRYENGQSIITCTKNLE